MIVIIMGVTGSGKTTIGELLAARLGLIFADADDYHPPANKAKMAAGHPLDDDDRHAWLETLNQLLRGWFTSGAGGILACSALKEKYRAMLGEGLPEGALTFCLLNGSKELIAGRLAQRHHEYMNPKLLDSQIATLELPPESEAFRIPIDQTPAEMVEAILKDLAKDVADPSAGIPAPPMPKSASTAPGSLPAQAVQPAQAAPIGNTGPGRPS